MPVILSQGYEKNVIVVFKQLVDLQVTVCGDFSQIILFPAPVCFAVINAILRTVIMWANKNRN